METEEGVLSPFFFPGGEKRIADSRTSQESQEDAKDWGCKEEAEKKKRVEKKWSKIVYFSLCLSVSLFRFLFP